MKSIVIIGSGGHAKVVVDIIEKMNQYTIVGFIDSYKASGSEVYGYKVLGDEEILLHASDSIHGGIIAIGDNGTRATIAEKISQKFPNFQFVSAVHPDACLARGVTIGNGSVIMAGSIINSDTIIGNHCIINTKASVDHDGVIGDFVSVAPGATIGGNTKVGNHSAISIGAVISHSISIGEHTVIGAGSTVLTHIESFKVAYGTPAKVVRERVFGDPYLKIS